MAQKVFWVLRLVEQLDPVPSQYFKKLVTTDDLWEVRALHGGGTFRITTKFWFTRSSGALTAGHQRSSSMASA